VARLRAVGCVWAEEEAELLSSAFSDQALETAVRSREAGQPLAHILGTAEFAGLQVAVGPGVFVPRPRAEPLVDASLAYLKAHRNPRVLDLGCGCGALAAALKHRCPDAEVHASDVDPLVCDYARRNGARFGFTVHRANWLDGLGDFDLVVAYLPHVPSYHLERLDSSHLQAEGAATVDGGLDGLDPLRAILPELRSPLITLLEEGQLAAAQELGNLTVLLRDEEDRVVLYLPALRASK